MKRSMITKDQAPSLTDLERSLLDALKGSVRMLEAVRYSGGLHGSQIERLNAAKALIAETEQSA